MIQYQRFMIREKNSSFFTLTHNSILTVNAVIWFVPIILLVFLIIIIEEMDLEPKSLYTKGRVSNLGKLYGKWKVKKQGSQAA